MKLSTIFTIGFAAFVFAVPTPEAEADAVAKRNYGSSAIMASGEPVDLVTRQANTTATNAAATGKGMDSSETSSKP
jgi:hypothetical protein